MLLSLAFTGLLVSQSLRLPWRSPVGGGGLGRVDENVVLLELLDVAFDLVHLLGQRFHPVLLAQSIEFGVVGFLLVVLVDHFPLLLKSGDQVLALAVRHQELLSVLLVLLLDLHFAHEVILVLDFVLDLGQVSWNFSEGFLFKIILVLGRGKVGSGQNVFNSVGNDEVFIADETVDGLFVTLGDSRLFVVCCTLVPFD